MTTASGGPSKRRSAPAPARTTSKDAKASAKAFAKATAPRKAAASKPKASVKAGARPAAKPKAAATKTATKTATRTASKASPKPKGSTGPGRAKARRDRRAHGKLLGATLLTIALAAFLLIAYFPTRTYLSQRRDTQAAAHQLAALKAHNAALDRRITRLQTKDEIERIARQEYGLVRPGEESYAILPAPPPPVKLPNVWPFVGVADTLNQ